MERERERERERESEVLSPPKDARRSNMKAAVVEKHLVLRHIRFP